MLTLFRIRLSLMNGLAAVAGSLLYPTITTNIIATSFAGVTLITAAASAVNQAMEKQYDAMMTRTMFRPVPQGRIAPAAAAFFGVLTGLTGFAILLCGGAGIIPVLVALLALLCYLFIYTPLKSRSSLVLPLGAMCGSMPLLVGWCNAGGALGDFRAMILAGTFFLWQIPHFWLLQQRYSMDCSKSCLPFFINGSERLFWLWLLAFSVSVIMLPVFGLVRVGAFVTVLFPVPLVLSYFTKSRWWQFGYINCYPIVITILLVLEHTQFGRR